MNNKKNISDRIKPILMEFWGWDEEMWKLWKGCPLHQDIDLIAEKIEKQARQEGIQQGKLELQKWCGKWWRHQETSNELWRHSTEENLIRFLEALKKEVKSQND